MRAIAQEGPIYRAFLRFSCLSALTLLACARANPPPESEDVTIQLANGDALHGTLFTPANPSPPALLLLPMLGSDRNAWEGFARAASADGYMVLAVDLRANGDAGSRRSSADTYPADARVRLDLPATLRYLVDRGADPDNLAIAGASLGANLALKFAARHPEIQAVIMLSPGENYRGVAALPELEIYVRRPLLLMSSEGDSYSASTARKMQSLADENYCELRMYRGSSHGTDLLSAIPGTSGEILAWLEPILAANAAKTP